MKCRIASIPADSLLLQIATIDYTDGFVCTIPGKMSFTADDVQACFWQTIPGWVAFLMKIRKILVRPFGLRGQFLASPEKFAEGIYNGKGDGFMTVPMKNHQETVVKLSDKHLHSYMSVYIQAGEENTNVILNSTVQYHNRLGRVYFFLIKPIHKLVVTSMLKQALRKLTAPGK